MVDSFASRMAALDAIVEQCRGKGVFASGKIDDASNRSGRDWPWWGVRIIHDEDDDFEHRRTSAEILLHAPQADGTSSFVGKWSVRIWRGVSPDRFKAGGERTYDWDMPTAEQLDDAFAKLFAEAKGVLGRE